MDTHFHIDNSNIYFMSDINLGRLRIFENRILRRIFGPKKDENGEWRRLHSEELHTLHRSCDIGSGIKPRRFRWSCSQHGGR